jgi:hypothetical protein
MSDAEQPRLKTSALDDFEDPLLELFRKNSDFTTENFLNELRKQRTPGPVPEAAMA